MSMIVVDDDGVADAVAVVGLGVVGCVDRLLSFARLPALPFLPATCDIMLKPQATQFTIDRLRNARNYKKRTTCAESLLQNWCIR